MRKRGAGYGAYQLRYFARAAAYENISMAAQDLHVTQPSISKAVKALEKELQVELMRRNGKYCELTHEGRRFQARILPVLAELDEIPAEIQNRRARKQIRVNVLSASFMMPSLIKKYRETHPDVFSRFWTGGRRSTGTSVSAVRFQRCFSAML
ncbi:MAG: LysR family transcriptional regulator [Enterocloster sp.]